MKTSERNKLRPMVEFVNRINELVPKEIDQSFHSWCTRQLLAIDNYAKFLSHPLTLGMLVPCDEEGELIEKPNNLTFELANDGHLASTWVVEEWNRAKERVMFEGFHVIGQDDDSIEIELKTGNLWLLFEEDVVKVNIEDNHIAYVFTIEEFVNFEKGFFELNLTPNALKEIYGS